jgi:hypothetical protein
MPVLEYLTVKGLIILGKAIAAKGMGAKVGYLLFKSISAYGLSATIGTTLLVGLVVGGVYWTKERVDFLKYGLKALEDGDLAKAALNLGRLALSANVHVSTLPDTVHDYLVAAHISEEKARTVAEAIKSMESEIAQQVKRLK